MLGWMALNSTPSLSGPVDCHETPRSRVRSKWICHLLGLPGDSVLDGQSNSPPANSIGLFLIGPSTPSGRRCGFDHDLPPSVDDMSIPHHELGAGPAL